MYLTIYLTGLAVTWIMTIRQEIVDCSTNIYGKRFLVQNSFKKTFNSSIFVTAGLAIIWPILTFIVFWDLYQDYKTLKKLIKRQNSNQNEETNS